MRKFLRPSHLVIAAMFGAACWAGDQEEEPIVPSGDPMDRVFREPRVCLDLDAPADKFFREIPIHVEDKKRVDSDFIPALVRIQPEHPEPFQPDPRALKFLATSDEEAAARYEQIKRDMAELILRHPGSPAAIEAKHLLNNAGKHVELKGKLAQRQFMFGGVTFTR